MGDEYTKGERIRASAYFIYQTLTFPARFLFENYPNSLGADFLTPRECLQKARGGRLQAMLERE